MDRKDIKRVLNKIISRLKDSNRRAITHRRQNKTALSKTSSFLRYTYRQNNKHKRIFSF